MVERERGGGAHSQIRQPTWLRTGVDGGNLLLCDPHADLLLARGGERT
jgi:hypothetical protein